MPLRTSVILAAVWLSLWAQTMAGANEKPAKLPKTMIMKTNMGTITFELYPEKAPVTVEKITGLAAGKIAFTDPKTGKQTKRKFYDGLTFHRIVPGFVIQGGDPAGNGTGGPGFTFKNEWSDLEFDRAGRLAMANAGRDTNGSQFFITLAPVHLSKYDYTIFGQVVEGMDVVQKIAKVRTRGEMPVEPVVIQSVTVK